MSKMLGYCTNVHAGTGIEMTRQNLERYAVEVKKRFSPEASMGLGLWLSAKAARELIESDGVGDFRDWLSGQGLVPFTMNGFPFGDFHQKVVKHDVYLPVWGDEKRTAYTLDLIEILDVLLPPGMIGTISTLPVAWSETTATAERAAAELLSVARHLAQLKESKSREIVICIEPEPGCLFQRSADIVSFFEDHLFNKDKVAASDIQAARAHLQVCHDVCHAAVMFEPQVDVINAYRAAGIGIGKVQISSAIAVPFFEMDVAGQQAALARLAEFAEDRYLHQTVCQNRTTGQTEFFEDLPIALAAAPGRQLQEEEWRVHFHVPLFADHLGSLMTTQVAAESCLSELATENELPHFEVETYAWEVLPADLAAGDLAANISREMKWAAEHLRV